MANLKRRLGRQQKTPLKQGEVDAFERPKHCAPLSPREGGKRCQWGPGGLLTATNLTKSGTIQERVGEWHISEK
eukprot:1159970-Pelagomonas_calceolata.AAC.4